MREANSSLQSTSRTADFFVVSLQSEYGDLYKVTLEYSGDAVTELRVKYFDTIPPCTSVCVLKTGFLFAASEFGNHALYQFLVRLHALFCLCIMGSVLISVSTEQQTCTVYSSAACRTPWLRLSCMATSVA